MSGWAAVLAAVAFISCGGGAALGEDCAQAGGTDGECEEGGVCADDGSGTLKCLEICDDHEDCPSGEDCNGVEGSSLKGCRTDK